MLIFVLLEDGDPIGIDGGPRPGRHGGIPHPPSERRGMVVLPRVVAAAPRIGGVGQQLLRIQRIPRNSAHAQAEGQRQAHAPDAAERRIGPRGGDAVGRIDGAHPGGPTAAPGIDRIAHGNGGMEAAQDTECLSQFCKFGHWHSCRRAKPWEGTVPQEVAAVQPVGHVQQRLRGAADGRIPGRGTCNIATCIHKIDEKPAGAPKFSPKILTRIFPSNPFLIQEAEVLGRIADSADDPLGLELSGHALLDMYPERRGNIFSDEVYRLTKAYDATSVFGRPGADDDDTSSSSTDDITDNSNINYLPPNHKVSTNDVIMLTLQPAGSGDFFGPSTLPTGKDATTVECRVLNTGPTYVDVAIPGGSFEAAFGPAPNNVGSAGRGDRSMRLRVDRYFSNVPYERMVAALGQITALPERAKQPPQKNDHNNNAKKKEMDIQMDEVLRDAIVSTYRHGEEGAETMEQACDIGDLCRKLARPPLPNSAQLAKQALDFMQSDRAAQFPQFNEPQLTAIGAALTRRLTMIQGPPGM